MHTGTNKGQEIKEVVGKAKGKISNLPIALTGNFQFQALGDSSTDSLIPFNETTFLGGLRVSFECQPHPTSKWRRQGHDFRYFYCLSGDSAPSLLPLCWLVGFYVE